MKLANFLVLVLFALFGFGCSVTPDYLSDLTAPITYSLAVNAVKMNLSNFELDIMAKCSNLSLDSSGWPKGEVIYNVKTDLYKNKKAFVRYVLNGTPIATAIVEIDEQKSQQFNVNLYERAKILGQSVTVESIIEQLSNELCKGVPKQLKVAVIDFVGIDDQKYAVGTWIAESFINYAIKNEMQIVERRLLSKLIKEIEFTQSELASIDTRKIIGEILGADVVVMGTIKVEKEEIIVNSRSIRLSDGVILTTAQEIIPIYLLKNTDL